mgnify:CR=1 FL=1
MRTHDAKTSTALKANGWAPVLHYANGGRVIGKTRHSSLEIAHEAAKEMLHQRVKYPEHFVQPDPNRLIEE